jgi:hypothetical protein
LSWTNFFQSLAELEHDDEFVTGRPGGLSAELASRIAKDIAEKLELNDSDALLDYGSGTGAITRELASQVAKATAADSSAVIVKRGKASGSHMEWVELGPDKSPTTGGFTKVLSYYNAHTFENHSGVRTHIEALSDAVAPGGVVMLGDIPDLERTGQWKSGERGREENRTVWMGRLERRGLDIERDERNLASFTERIKRLGIEPPASFGDQHPGFDRDIVTRMFRENGGSVAVVTQPMDFPNAHTCVDYIVRFG